MKFGFYGMSGTSGYTYVTNYSKCEQLKKYMGRSYLCKGFFNPVEAEEWAVDRYNELTHSSLAHIGQMKRTGQIIFTKDMLAEYRQPNKQLVTFTYPLTIVDQRLKGQLEDTPTI